MSKIRGCRRRLSLFSSISQYFVATVLKNIHYSNFCTVILVIYCIANCQCTFRRRGLLKGSLDTWLRYLIRIKEIRAYFKPYFKSVATLHCSGLNILWKQYSTGFHAQYDIIPKQRNVMPQFTHVVHKTAEWTSQNFTAKALHHQARDRSLHTKAYPITFIPQ